MIDALDIWVKGIVQGVGFRPFVYKLARRYLINGWVLNAVDGVHIHAEGESKHLDEFVLELSENAPQAAQVSEIEITEVPIEPFDSFEIRTSDDEGADDTTFVSPDLATCEQCREELFDPGDRRYRYPFINCTNCGPRFTIINELPYDRANTSMHRFEMCKECRSEYDDPADRRFHAQPDACFACGPTISLWLPDDAQKQGRNREESDAIFAEAVDMLLEGKIIAVKGLGGFHLVCDANNEHAVAKLRERKHRFGKPLAVMVDSLDSAREICHVNDEEAAILEGAVRPIVLLRKLRQRSGGSAVSFAEGLADFLPELGVMLPYTPVQHILLHDFAKSYASRDFVQDAGKRTNVSCETISAKSEGEPGTARGGLAGNPPMLVMTSGNIHDEPIVISNEEAIDKLGQIADAIIMNDRDIVARFDDSVLRVIDVGDGEQAIQFIRRSRGYAPAPILVDGVAENVFATGAEQKNTFTLLRGYPSASNDTGNGCTESASDNPENSASMQSEAFVSQHIGDMENAETFDAWIEAKSRYEKLFNFHTKKLACDLHPEYLTSKWAHAQIASGNADELIEVQHHHAHIVSAMAENHLADAVCGIAFDGTGFGADGNIWGGEVLISNLRDYERFINFSYVAMPGGAAAIKHPLRMAFGVLDTFDLLDHSGAAYVLEQLGDAQISNMETMIEQGINTPFTSSAGRLFDAASAILGICTNPSYEGEAAILLEGALWNELDSGSTQDGNNADSPYAIDVIKNVATEDSTAHDTSVLLFDAAPAFKALLDDREAGVGTGVIARRFHDAFVGAVVQAAQFAEALYGIKTVVLTGGVFMNRYLIEQSTAQLKDAGFTVAINRELPPNDGCISFGQAIAAL